MFFLLLLVRQSIRFVLNKNYVLVSLRSVYQITKYIDRYYCKVFCNLIGLSALLGTELFKCPNLYMQVLTIGVFQCNCYSICQYCTYWLLARVNCLATLVCRVDLKGFKIRDHGSSLLSSQAVKQVYLWSIVITKPDKIYPSTTSFSCWSC